MRDAAPRFDDGDHTEVPDETGGELQVSQTNSAQCPAPLHNGPYTARGYQLLRFAETSRGDWFEQECVSSILSSPAIQCRLTGKCLKKHENRPKMAHFWGCVGLRHLGIYGFQDRGAKSLRPVPRSSRFEERPSGD